VEVAQIAVEERWEIVVEKCVKNVVMVKHSCICLNPHLFCTWHWYVLLNLCYG